MSAAKKRPEQALSKVLVEGFPDAGMFEDIPRVRKIAPESSEPWVLLVLRIGHGKANESSDG